MFFVRKKTVAHPDNQTIQCDTIVGLVVGGKVGQFLGQCFVQALGLRSCSTIHVLKFARRVCYKGPATKFNLHC
jgi:hypothetical protein